MHLGQNKLNNIIFDKLKNQQNFNKDQILFGHYLYDFDYNSNEKIYNIKYKSSEINNSTNDKIIKAKYIVGCDGSHSLVRKKLEINYNGEPSIQNFINAHFFSKELADKLKKIKKESMLHFIFNPSFVCVLITYDIDKGEFVLQIPYFTKVEKESDFTKSVCLDILSKLISKDEKAVKDIVKIKLIYEYSRDQTLENEECSCRYMA